MDGNIDRISQYLEYLRRKASGQADEDGDMRMFEGITKEMDEKFTIGDDGEVSDRNAAFVKALQELNALKKKIANRKEAGFDAITDGRLDSTVGKISKSFVQCANFMDLFAADGDE